MTAPYREMHCVDCRTNTSGREYYVIADDLWAAAGIAPTGGMLCIRCLEQRLGRTLTPADFTDCPVNRAPFFRRSRRLQQRLTETPLL